jgi:hypothetical protein
MTPEFKAKWIEALRSGKYQQTRGALKDDKGMCCLGVAADLIDSSQWNDEPVGLHHERGWRGCEPQNCKAVAEAIGIHLRDAQDLATRNDGTENYSNHEHSFAEIATVIEEQL